MKVFPLLAKELLAGAENPENHSEPVKPVREYHYPPSEAKDVLAEIPDVTDTPAEEEILGEEASPRSGGRLISPTLSARILLGGGLLLFLIAAMPIVFHLDSPSEEAKSPSTGEGLQAPASRTPESPQGKGQKPSLTNKQPSPNKVPQGTASEKPTQAPGVQHAAQSKSNPHPRVSPGFEVQKPGTEPLAHRGGSSGGSSQTRPASGGKPGGVMPPPDGSAPRGPSGAFPVGFQEEIFSEAGSSQEWGSEGNPRGNFSENRAGMPYSPTSANYPNTANNQIVYYPSTDGSWYPVVFPPRNSQAQRPTPTQASRIPERSFSGRSGASGATDRYPSTGYPPSGYVPSSEYPAASGREVGGPSAGTAYVADRRYAPPPGWEPPNRTYPETRTRVGGELAEPGGPDLQPEMPYGAVPSPGGPVPRGNEPRWNRGSSDFSSSSGGFPSQGPGGSIVEPGVARFQGIIEKPTVRSAYDGTGSSVY